MTSRTQPLDGTDPVETWATYATEYAGLEPAAASAVVRAVGTAFTAPVSHLVPMRYRGDVLASHRVKLGSRIFPIRGLGSDPRTRELVLAVEERIG